jgi:preprotein translocase subunit SecE
MSGFASNSLERGRIEADQAANGTRKIDVMAQVTPGQFVREVRQELSKVTWPSRRETTMSVVLVFVMCVVLGLYFMVVDRILIWGLSLIFG